MGTLVEISEYIDQVLRLDLETPVKGFDGTEIGPSNEQAQVLANRTKWLKERLTKLSESLEDIKDREYVASINKKTGAITLTYSDVGAAAKDHTHDASEITTTDEKQFVSVEDKNNWNDKQEKLISGTTLKTVLGISLLGSGDITIKSSQITTDETARFVTDDEIQKWNTKQTKLVSGTNISTLHGKTLLSGDDVKLSYSDVGADKSGAGTEAVAAHVSEDDPHTQYLTLARAKENVVFKDTGNQANGYLQLDDKGHIPIEFIELFQAKYVIVGNKAERLAIEKAGDITICLETDTNKIYYLNGFEDPSVEGNWKEGQSTEINTVASVFGRVGSIKAQTGDYTADQITETSKRVFVTPDNKTTWDAKQEKLVSGTNIRTVNGESLLGSTDIEITTDSIGAAEKEHTHKPSEITTDADAQFVSEEEKKVWSAKQDNLVSGTNIKTINEKDLVGKGNIDLTYSDVGAAAAEHKHSPSDIKTDDNNSFVSADEKKTWNAKQATLVSGTSIKTLNEESLLGEGDITIDVSSIGAAEKKHQHKPSDIETDDDNQFVSQSDRKLWTEKQDKLISGKTLATVFGQSLLSDSNLGLSNVEDFGNEVNNVLSAGPGVSLQYDEDSDKVTISVDTKSTSIIVNDVEEAVADTEYPYPAKRNNFDFVAYALEKKVAIEKHTATLDYDALPETSVLSLNTPPIFDSTGYIPDSDGAVSYAMNATSSNYESYITDEIPVPTGGNITRVGIDLGGNGKPLVETMTSSENDKVSVSANNAETGYDAWKIFNNREKTGVLKDKEYWRAAQAWSNRPGLPIITIIFKEPITIDSFGIQTYSAFESVSGIQSTPATKLALQCRSSDSDPWVQITTSYFTIPNLFDTSKPWVITKLDKQITFTQFQIIVREVRNTDRVAALTAFQFFNGIGGLLKSAAGDYYTVIDNALSKVTPSSTMFKDNSFGGTEIPLPLDDVKDLYPLKVCSSGISDIKVTNYTTAPRIAINYPLDTTLPWAVLQDFDIAETYTEADVTNLRCAATLNGKRHYIFKNNAWTTIDILTNNAVSANVLIEKGMTVAEFTAITAEQWAEFMVNMDADNGIGISYAINTENSNDKITAKSLNLEFNDFLYWRKMAGDEVEVQLQDDKIVFKPAKSGAFKFCYKFN